MDSKDSGSDFPLPGSVFNIYFFCKGKENQMWNTTQNLGVVLISPRFSRTASIPLFFLSYPCVAAAELYDPLLSLLYLYVAYVLIKRTPNLFSACNCRSKHHFWRFSCTLCHLEGERWRQLAVRGAGSIWYCSVQCCPRARRTIICLLH